MTTGRVVALICLVVFGALAVVIARTGVKDWREARAERERGFMLIALDTFRPALISGAMAVASLVWLIVG